MLVALSKFVRVLFAFVVLTVNVISQKVTAKLGSNYTLLNKLVAIWTGSKYSLPTLVSEVKPVDTDSMKLCAAVEMEVQQAWQQINPNFLNNYPISQKRLGSSQTNDAEETQTSASVESTAQSTPKRLPRKQRPQSCQFGSTPKRFMSSVDLKLEEYNAMNTQYVLHKYLDRQYGIDASSVNRASLPKELDDAAICQLMFPSTNPLILSKLANLPKMKPSKHRRQLSFQPTKLSTIFENLAY